MAIGALISEPDWMAARDGSTAALGALYERYASLVYRAAYRVTGSEADAADVTHDVFLALPDALRSYSDRGRFEGWLRTIAVRTALGRLRSERRRERNEARASPHQSTTAAEAQPEVLILARQALNRLPREQRTVLVLKELEGYTHAEIAHLLGISEGASKLRLFRAWRALRRKMET